ncbi:MAG: hypothetical protein IJH83_03960 [Coriobacteriales bacterium]|nr:hypothetical protein [Coriobacteriales bacterium]
MHEELESYLFTQGILVATGDAPVEDSQKVRAALAFQFNIKITEGLELAQSRMIDFVGRQLGVNVPEGFYRNFPQSVLYLRERPDVLWFDQMLSYLRTYGLDNWDEPVHSQFEPDIVRSPFSEQNPPRLMRIMDSTQALKTLFAQAKDLLSSSRPLSARQVDMIARLMQDEGFQPEVCASKNTAIKLLARTRDLRFLDFLELPDILKLVEYIDHEYVDDKGDPTGKGLRKLNLKNQDRKLVGACLDRTFSEREVDFTACYERKALWSGLLHHIHYQPKTGIAQDFCDAMRGKDNESVYSRFQAALDAGEIARAVEILLQGKGHGALMRNLDLLLSRCETDEQVDLVTSQVDGSIILLLQLLMHYSVEDVGGPRTFSFNRFDMLTVHREDEQEQARRRSRLKPELRERMAALIRTKLERKLHGKLGRVFVDPGMHRIALPLQENNAQGGLGVLPKGSRIPLETGKKIRAFTYWEKVDDIDLSAIVITRDGSQLEFSWRSMWNAQSKAIMFSGDETSGFKGGSEFYDIVPELFKKEYPQARYLVFCDNVYTRTNFDQCVCRAGYMLRDIEDTGEVFEPKTVRSSFTIDCKSTFAYLFALDLDRDEFVWLNCARAGKSIIAGTTLLGFLVKYLESTDVMDLGSFFELMATEQVDDPELADVVLSDAIEDPSGIAGALIRSCDTPRILALMKS